MTMNKRDFKAAYAICEKAIENNFDIFKLGKISDIKQAFQSVCNDISNDKRNISLEFSLDGDTIFNVVKHDNGDSVVFCVDLRCIDSGSMRRFLLGQTTCFDFLVENSKLIEKNTKGMAVLKQVLLEAGNSWQQFVERTGYNNIEIVDPDELPTALGLIKKKHVIWCYNKSCTGKTFLGLRVLQYMNPTKIVYNPTADCSCDLDALKLIIEFGKNCSILIDDLQCDVELAKLLFQSVNEKMESISKRNNHIFMISWSSLANDSFFSEYCEKFAVIETHPNRFINAIRSKITDGRLLEICKDNLALISTAKIISEQRKVTSGDPSVDLFEYFVRTNDKKQLKYIHIMAVLGIYEYETPKRFIQNIQDFGNIDIDNIINNVITAKEFDDSIFLAHRTISEFIAHFIETKYKDELKSRHEIIKGYINFIDSKKKWKALLHLIGEENGQSELFATNKQWNCMSSFQNSIKKQTDRDPSWHNTPSSMFFVIAVADMLGVVDEYTCVIDKLCSMFINKDGHFEVRFDLLQTTHDFERIHERMIEEDRECDDYDYEVGVDIDKDLMHTNWLYGLMVGVKHSLVEYGHSDLINKIEKELIQNQNEEGYWYPKRVPWVTARILIGLSSAGYSIRDNCVKRGVEYLISQQINGKWEAHTGGWNTVYETTSLCLEALIKCGVNCESEVPQTINFLENSSAIWKQEANEIDGTVSACQLAKLRGYQSYRGYADDLVSRNIDRIVSKENDIDYDSAQSCKITQIAYYVIELCWYIFGKELGDLLSNYDTRSKETIRGEIMGKKIFVSYSEDSKSHVKRIAKIVDSLRSHGGYDVLFYEDEKLGTNNMEFMQKINQCDAILVIGTKKYKKKSMETRVGGVWFEACILAREFMNENYQKIIPIAFDEFNESFPEPLPINKGLRAKRIDEYFLKQLNHQLDIFFTKEA